MAHILLVDDETILLCVMETLLRDAGHTVSTAETAAAAFPLLTQHNPALVICDVMLPGQTGIDFYTAARTHLGDACPPFLFISAYEPSHARRMLATHTGVGFISKSFQIDDLLAAVTAALN